MNRIDRLENEIVRLQAMIEGIEQLADVAVPIDNGIKSYSERRAGNALVPMIEAAHEKSEQILQEVGQLTLDAHQSARKASDPEWIRNLDDDTREKVERLAVELITFREMAQEK